ncbi:MAG: hypothetical protein RIS64_4007 [Bacteroidota bacterium]|jgi:hypothetical protein
MGFANQRPNKPLEFKFLAHRMLEKYKREKPDFELNTSPKQFEQLQKAN